MLALNVLHRGYGGLTRPLGLIQGAPIGFLWLEKTSVLIFGSNEYALRLVPLLAGLASMILFDPLAQRVLGGWARCVPVAIFAISPTLVYYASEAKQYGVDVFAFVALWWFCAWLLDSALTWKRVLLWSGTCAVLIWCSFPAAFAAGGTACVLMLAAARRRSLHDAELVAVATAVWLVSFVAEYFVALRQLHSVKALLGYWQSGFAPRPLQIGTAVSWVGATTRGLLQMPLDFGLWPFACALVLCGLITLLRKRTLAGLFVVILLGAVYAAAVLHEYPLEGRLALFLMPIGCVAVAAPLLISRTPAFQLFVALLIVAITIPTVGSAVHTLVSPYTKTEAREAYVYVLQHERPGDKLLVEWTGVAVYVYYHETLGVTGEGTFRLSGSTAACPNGTQLNALRRYGRVWFVWAVPPGFEPKAVPQYMQALRHLGRILIVHETPGNAGAVLVRVSRTLSSPELHLAAPAWAPDPQGCLRFRLSPLPS